ncbi:MAG: flagellar biosynthetic protein FliO [Planctomycetaceae bacterium]|jgi:flagellar biogenesis protein FliO|nr:flagellar biosynthetic protein FliO [Planctomycetaceae bacterium]
MPKFHFLTILIVTVILAGVVEQSQLVAEEPDRPFVSRPSVAFTPNNFTKPTVSSTHSTTSASTSSAPNPPKSSEQLQYIGNSLTSTPITSRNNGQSYQSTQQISSSVPPVQTEYGHSNHNALPPVQQVSGIEPAQSFGKTADARESLRTAESRKESELTVTRENTVIDRAIGIPAKNGNAGTFKETNYETISENELDHELTNELNELKNSGKQNNQSADHFSKPLLDKTIDSGKTGNDKKLLNRPKIANAITPLIPVLGSLLIVIGVFLILALFLKKVSPKGNRLLPKEAFEDLGRAVLTQKIQLHLLRLGNRLLLVSMTPDGVSPITEITDPDEVVPLLGLCRQLDSHSSTEFFRKTLSSFSTSGGEGGYFGTDVAPTMDPNNLIGNNHRKTSSRNNRSKQTSLVDIYSEPDESLAEILAKGGGQHG